MSVRACSLLALLVACGDGGGNTESTTPDACDVSSSVLASELDLSVALTVTARYAVVATRPDVSTPTELWSAPLDGSGQQRIYSSSDGAAIYSLAAVGDDVLYLEQPAAFEPSNLYRVPAGGGTPDLVASGFEGVERLAGVADGAAFVVETDPPRVRRVDLDSGAVSVVADTTGLGTALHLSVSGGEVLFTGAEDDSTGLAGAAYSVPVGASNATPTLRISGSEHPECGFPLGGLTGTPDHLVCGFDEVAVFDRADDAFVDVIVSGGVDTLGHVVVGSAGETVFLAELGDGTADRRIFRVETSGGGFEAIACDAGRVSWGTVDGFFPDQTSYQVGVAEDGAVVWVDERWSDGAFVPVVTLRMSGA